MNIAVGIIVLLVLAGGYVAFSVRRTHMRRQERHDRRRRSMLHQRLWDAVMVPKRKQLTYMPRDEES